MLRNVIQVVVVLAILRGFYAALNTLWPTPTSAVAGEGATTLTASANQPQPLSGIAARFNKHLLVRGADGEVHGFPETKLAGIKYWAFYYSASWCPPCRAFTPRLVDFYNSFKPSHPDFELIFVSCDNSDSDAVGYMKMDSMPWPAVGYAEIANPALEAKKYSCPYIPCLVLVDANGNVLSNTFENGQYTGPNHVVDDIARMVQ
jgi:nucleoredoxin